MQDRIKVGFETVISSLRKHLDNVNEDLRSVARKEFNVGDPVRWLRDPERSPASFSYGRFLSGDATTTALESEGKIVFVATVRVERRDKAL